MEGRSEYPSPREGPCLAVGRTVVFISKDRVSPLRLAQYYNYLTVLKKIMFTCTQTIEYEVIIDLSIEYKVLYA